MHKKPEKSLEHIKTRSRGGRRERISWLILSFILMNKCSLSNERNLKLFLFYEIIVPFPTKFFHSMTRQKINDPARGRSETVLQEGFF